MTSSEIPTTVGRRVTNVLHPTDFTEQSDHALAHALRIALTNKANLCLLHAGKNSDQQWEAFPSVRQFLQRWGVVPEGASETDVTDLGLGIEKVIDDSRSVAESIADYCQIHPIDAIVLATAGRDGVAAWLMPSKAEQIAEEVAALSIPTLFVPAKRGGCVDIDNGRVSMENVLVPVDHEPSSNSAIERALRAISLYGGEPAKLTLLHVGSESEFPEVEIPDGRWKIERVVRKGNAAAEIVATAEAIQANLIVMVTEGTDGLLDILRGTTTAQVLRNAPCPLLAIPAAS